MRSFHFWRKIGCRDVYGLPKHKLTAPPTVLRDQKVKAITGHNSNYSTLLRSIRNPLMQFEKEKLGIVPKKSFDEFQSSDDRQTKTQIWQEY